MSRNVRTPKVVADPIHGIIDIRPVLAMVETEEFQALGDKRQLGMAYLTFPSATHSRKAHSLGSYQATRDLADRWIEFGFINKKEADALAGYALYHDIGHPAFSHVTEALCPPPAGIDGMSMNAALSLEIIRKRRKEIEACGIDFKLLESFAHRKNPLYLAVSDKNLGMEKLDYLERDGLSTILGKPVGLSYLRNHIYFIKGAIAVDEKVVDAAIEAQNFYLKMYKNVYLRKTSAIAQRMLQKMTHRLILAGEIEASDLVRFTDSELLGIMLRSNDETVRAMYSLLKTRDLYREAIVMRPERFADLETRPGKPVRTLAVKGSEMKRLIHAPTLRSTNQERLTALEEAVAGAAGLPAGSVLIAPIVTPERFEAQDILVYRGEGRSPASLRARYPAHFKNIEEVAEDYLTFRVCTTEEHREKLSSPNVAKKIFRMIVG